MTLLSKSLLKLCLHLVPFLRYSASKNGSFKVIEMAPFDRSYTTFYWSDIVSIALFGTVFESLDVK